MAKVIEYSTLLILLQLTACRPFYTQVFKLPQLKATRAIYGLLLRNDSLLLLSLPKPSAG